MGELTFTKYGMLYLEEQETAVIADLHIGYEDAMAMQGVFLPKIQERQIINTLEKIYNAFEPKRVIVNGDLKHEFSRNMPQEWQEIERIIDYITSLSELVVVRGNHDNFLKTILKRRGLEIHDSYSIGNFFFVHGHRDVELRGITIIGHEHPSVSFRDEVSAIIKVPCFLYAPDLIVLPALSIYAAGTDISKNDFISPILNKNRRDFEIFGIDESAGILPLGSLSSLQAHSADY